MAINPLQIPQIGTITPDITPTLANLVNTINQGQQRQQIAQTLSSLQPGPNGQIDPTPLLKSGNMSLAQLGLSVINQQNALKQQALQNARLNANDAFSHNLQTQQLDLARSNANKPVFKNVKDANGIDHLVKLDSDGNNPTPISVPGQTTAPTNPFVSGKMTTDQAKSGTMVDRMDQANQVITKNENINDGLTGYIGGSAAASPTIRDSAAFNYFASPARQATVQAQRNFVNAILRVESGAAISEQEFNNAQRQYFPQPGDSKDVIEQKRQNRIAAMRGMARQAGPAYKPPADIVPKAASQGGITQEQYNALPSGTPYTAPDGSQRVKR
jgi:hypothetical protein